VSRGPEVAAREIARRVLPTVRAETERVHAREALDIQTQTTINLLADRLAEHLGTTPRRVEEHRQGVHNRVIHLPQDGLYGEMTVSGYRDGTVDLKVSNLTPDLALELAEVIGRHNKPLDKP
jgi:hypothetical protein